MRFSFEDNLPEVNAAIVRKADTAMRAIDETLFRAALETANKSKRDVTKAFSQLSTSINIIRFGFADYGVNAGTNYARYVEEGTKPGGKPSIQSLIDWIKVRRITPDNPFDDAEDLAYMIQKSITLFGTKPKPFFEPAYRQVFSTLPSELRRNVRRAVES